jgi:hypothetical protein
VITKIIGVEKMDASGPSLMDGAHHVSGKKIEAS